MERLNVSDRSFLEKEHRFVVENHDAAIMRESWEGRMALKYDAKLFKEYALSNDQKLKIVETFDRAQTTRAIKLVYSTLAESFTGEKNVKKDVVKEFASKKTGGTAPSKKIISEENQVADRFRKLAGIL